MEAGKGEEEASRVLGFSTLPKVAGESLPQFLGSDLSGGSLGTTVQGGKGHLLLGVEINLHPGLVEAGAEVRVAKLIEEDFGELVEEMSSFLF